MMTLVYGSTTVKGELEGFTPGSTEFEIDLGQGCKILLTAKTDYMSKLFDKVRHSMSAVGLKGLKNSTIDFNKGNISLGEGNVETHTIPKSNTVKSAFIA